MARRNYRGENEQMSIESIFLVADCNNAIYQHHFDLSLNKLLAKQKESLYMSAIERDADMCKPCNLFEAAPMSSGFFACNFCKMFVDFAESCRIL